LITTQAGQLCNTVLAPGAKALQTIHDLVKVLVSKADLVGCGVAGYWVK
jgi:hypothetical protein